jgi:hypothetical protein
MPRRLEIGAGELAGEVIRVWPIPAREADAWLAGKIDDARLFLSLTSTPDAVYVRHLPNRRSYRPLLRAIAAWARTGARAVLFRSDSLEVTEHARKLGAVFTHRDKSGQWRAALPSREMRRWLDRFTSE